MYESGTHNPKKSKTLYLYLKLLKIISSFLWNLTGFYLNRDFVLKR